MAEAKKHTENATVCRTILLERERRTDRLTSVTEERLN